MKTTSYTSKFPVVSSVVFTVILSLLSFSLQAQKLTWNDTLDKKIDSAVASIMEKDQFPGVAVAIVQNGKVLKESYYGLASIEYQVPVSDSTVFWMASISKHFDCTGILRLQQEGKLNVKDRIDNYLDSLPESWKGITIEHLMTHTSGLPADGRDSFMEMNKLRYGEHYTSAQVYEQLKKDTLRFKPGTKFLYSGAGYSLLSLIMEKVSGLSYDAYMHENVFTPAGLQNAYLLDVVGIHPNQVTGYRNVLGKLQRDNNDFRFIKMETGHGGAVYATLKDMIRWNAALNTDEFLSKESKNAMWTSYVFENKISPFYGYGFYVNKPIVFHNGIAGTEYLKFLDTGIDIIVLTNLGWSDSPFKDEISDILGIIPDQTVDEFASIFDLEIDTKATINKDLIGSYEIMIDNYPLSPVIRNSGKGLEILWEEGTDPIQLIPLKNGNLMLFAESFYFPSPYLVVLKPMADSSEDGQLRLQIEAQGNDREILYKTK